jgi:CO/xanthine dehydrogenase Mo-binding subunit
MSVNKSVAKLDGKGLVHGKPAYTDDLAQQNSLIVKVLRSPHPFAQIVQIDTEKAEKIKGIKCIFTWKDVPDKLMSRAGQGYPEPSPYDKKILDKYVRYVGDAVAVVAGDDSHAVEDAMKLIDVEYKVLEPVIDFEKAKGADTVIHKGTFSKFEIGHDPEKNLAAGYEMEIGSVSQTLEDCDFVYKGRYYTQPQAHCMMEPHSAAAHMDYQGRLNIMTSTQTPFHVRRILSHNLDMPISKIRVIKPRIGGGYGGKQAIHGEFFVALVTLKTGQPSKIMYTRKEVFQSTYTRHQMRIDMKIGAMKDGTIRAIDMDVLSNTGAYGEHALTVLMVAGAKTLPLYNKVEAVAFRGDVVYTNTTPAGAYRGYGAIQGNYALESSIDEIASMIAMDPVEIRRKNMIREKETSKIFEIMGEGKEGTAMVIESCKLKECLDRCLEMIDWKEKYPRVEMEGDKVRGVGMALAMQGSGIPYVDMGASILKFNDDGSFNLLIGATDLGTGSDTILAQIAAEVLMVPLEKIIVYSSDTDLTPFDTGAYASSTTFISGHSVRIAAENMIEKIKEAGRKHFNSLEVEYDGSSLSAGQESIDLKELATVLYYSENMEQLVATGSFYGTNSPPPYMVGAVEVEIDKRTGRMEVIKYVASVDCGTTINPNLAKIQVEGALLQGIGMAMYEDAEYTSTGRLINNTMMKYNLPTRKEVGKIQVEFAESYEPSGPFGAKSVGEIGIDTPPAAISNAIKNALGVRMNRLPMKSQDIWEKTRKK